MASLDITYKNEYTAEMLNIIWQNLSLKSDAKVLTLNHKYRCFSNFYKHEPITFKVPDFCWSFEMEQSGKPQVVEVEYSGKSIMLCKAALMKDHVRYQEIIESNKQKITNSLGKKVCPFNQITWDNNVCAIALEVIKQKFTS